MSPEFVLIGDPVAHSLSPAMHNALYQELGKVKWPFSRWHYSAVRCENAQDAREQINLVRTGVTRGMNITMPWKKLAFDNADFADAAVVAAGGANVLVRDEDLKLCAYNTDGPWRRACHRARDGQTARGCPCAHMRHGPDIPCHCHRVRAGGCRRGHASLTRRGKGAVLRESHEDERRPIRGCRAAWEGLLVRRGTRAQGRCRRRRDTARYGAG